MKNIARISNEYNSQLSSDIWNEDLKEYIRNLDVFIDTRNRQFSYDAIENQMLKQNLMKGAKCITVDAKGYVQSEWETFSVYHKCTEKELSLLVEHLEKIFTHKNDYLVENVEELITGHTKIVDKCIISVSYPEFPELQDIVKVIEEMQNGVKVFDEFKLIK